MGGRPQLITTGTGETHVAGGFVSTLLNPPGLVGVSANGQDVYFSTYDTLVSQDHNGLFLKFYDARSGGGFSAPAPPPPCEAADECHGADSSPPAAMQDETGASLSGGNLGEGAIPGQAQGETAATASPQGASAASPSRPSGRRRCRMRPRSSTRRSLLAVFVVAAAMALPASAGANAPITTYSGLPSTGQAGGHPDVEVHFAVENRVLQHSQSPCNCEDAKDAIVHLPPGFIGNPHATPQCTVAEFSADECPIDSQVGIANVNATNGIPFDAAVYNILPPPDVAGLLGFKIFLFDTPQFTVLSSRTGGDYGLDADTTSIFHGVFPLQELRQQLWGVPADTSHDLLRLDRTKVPGEAAVLHR